MRSVASNDAQDLALFRERMRRVKHNEVYYFSVNDCIAVLTGTSNPQAYWSTLKNRLKAEGAQETLAEIVPFRLPGADGRLRTTDTATRQTILRLLQSIPSPHAEKFKVALAQLAEERLEELEQPEAAIERLKVYYRELGRAEAWIDVRINSLVIRNHLTDQWEYRGAREGVEYAILTNTIHKGTFNLSVEEHKALKKLASRDPLREHLGIGELGVLAFAESVTAELHEQRNSQGFEQLKRDALDGGKAGGKARRLAEETLGRPIVTNENFLPSSPNQRRIRKKQEPPKLLD